MTIKELEQSGYPQTEYEDMILFAEKFDVGAKIYRVNVTEQAIELGEIVHIIHRSENPDWYDAHDYADFDKSLKGVSYSFSGEFILDDDCYYVFAEVDVNSTRYAIAYLDSDGTGFSTTEPFVKNDIYNEKDLENDTAALIKAGYQKVTPFTYDTLQHEEEMNEGFSWDFVNAHKLTMLNSLSAFTE